AMMLEHVSIGVSDLDRARAFYEAALKPLGYVLAYADPTMAGFGSRDKPQFWLNPYDRDDSRAKSANAGAHIAFAATNRKAVDAFHAAALAAGGRSYGRPGLRPEYHADYYGAFVVDPDGHHVEAVCHTKP